jgi:hypothetical protein
VINGGYSFIVAPAGYSGSLYRGKYAYEHHVVWWFYHGNAPQRGEDIHHRDGNKLNNTIRNLALMPKAEHAALHASSGVTRINQFHKLNRDFSIFMRSTELVIPRRCSLKIVPRVCKGCKTTFMTKNLEAKYCSHSCLYSNKPLRYHIKDLTSNQTDSSLARKYSVSPNAIRKARVKIGVKF